MSLLTSKIMETMAGVKTEYFRVKSTDLEDFTKFIHSVLPEEAEVSCHIAAMRNYLNTSTNVKITIPSRLEMIFKKIHACSMLL